MTSETLLIGLAGVLAAAAPVIFAVMGETFSERAGVINLSMNGSILLSAMGGFAVALNTGSLLLGFLAGAGIGALVALVVAFSSITLKQSQVAVGFVLALLTRDLAYFLGNPVMGQPGPRLQSLPLPGLSQLPVLGPLLFKQDLMTYLSFLLIFLAWAFIFRTRPGLMLQGIGERPAAAFVRGANVNRLRYFYTILGGALIGLAGPIYSLSVKAGWKGTHPGRRADWPGRADLLAFGQSRLEGHHLWAGRHRLDCTFHHHLRRLESHPRGARRLSFRPAAMAGAGASADFAGHSGSGAASCPLPADDFDPAAGQHRRQRMGGARPGRHARTSAPAGRKNSTRPARQTARRLGDNLRFRVKSRHDKISRLSLLALSA